MIYHLLVDRRRSARKQLLSGLRRSVHVFLVLFQPAGHGRALCLQLAEVDASRAVAERLFRARSARHVSAAWDINHVFVAHTCNNAITTHSMNYDCIQQESNRKAKYTK